MSHSMEKMWSHIIFGTKDRTNLIKDSFEKDLYSHIKEISKERFNCFVKTINATTDHIHILMLLDQSVSISEVIKNIKGNSSHWINEKAFMKNRFAWQTGYAAFSISESMINEVELYILHQKEHHDRISFTDEYKRLAEKYGFQIQTDESVIRH